MSLFIGLIVGASTWGVLADLIGCRLSFNITLFIAAVLGSLREVQTTSPHYARSSRAWDLV
jgi:uncharacterized membrane protein YeaQ/YmgE (transglycosylase-associated protein family)